MIVNRKILRFRSGDNKNKKIKRAEIPAEAPIKGESAPVKRYITPPTNIPIKKRLIEILSPNKLEIEFVVNKSKKIINISSNKP